MYKMEGVNKEYKESFGDAVLKTLCGFANTNGGYYWNIRQR